MTKVLVLYYSSYGHIEQMAYAAAEGAREGSAEGVVKRVPELVPEEIAQKSGYKLDQPAPIARVDELPDYDAIMIRCGTRFGAVASQMRNFLDQAGPLWLNGALVGKVGAVFTSSATPAWRPRVDHPHHYSHAAPPGHDRGRAALRVPGANGPR